jgi:signal transduction histidine kinase
MDDMLSEAGKVSELQKQFGKIKSSVQTMVDMLNDFLSIDKLEQGKIAVEFEKISIRNFIDEQISELDAIKKQGQEIIYTHHGPAEIIVEKKILRTILLNLLSNAIKYSSREIEILTEATDVLRITVKDHGIGIPVDQFENVFEKFFRAKNTGAIQGVGLGLNIVKRYAELLNGKITFTSQEGEGSLFLVEIPVKNAIGNNIP